MDNIINNNKRKNDELLIVKNRGVDSKKQKIDDKKESIFSLPNDIIYHHIIQYLIFNDIKSLRSTCKMLYQIVSENWKSTIHIKNLLILEKMYPNFKSKFKKLYFIDYDINTKDRFTFKQLISCLNKYNSFTSIEIVNENYGFFNLQNHHFLRFNTITELNIERITNKLLKYIPKSVISLNINFLENVVEDIIFPSETNLSELSIKFPNNNYFTDNIIYKFPTKLKSLTINNLPFKDDWLKHIPESVTKLEFKSCDKMTDNGLLKLHSSLTNLRIDNCSLITKKGLSKLTCLNKLYLNSFSKQEFDFEFQFSSNLSELSIFESKNYIFDEHLSDLSTKLWKLNLGNCTYITPEGICNLPSSLSWLYLVHYNPELLPETKFPENINHLKILSFLYKNNKYNKDDENKCLYVKFPEKLEYLHFDMYWDHIENCIIFQFEFSSILYELVLCCVYVSNTIILNKIPSTLSKLTLIRCKIDENGKLEFPKNLKYLHLSGNIGPIKDDNLIELPQTLEILELHCEGLSNEGLKNLPENLSEITIDSHHMPEIIPEITNDLYDRFRSILQLINAVCKISNEGMKNLPKKLKRLTLKDCSHITDEGLKFLPQNLVELNVLEQDNLTLKGLSVLPETLTIKSKLLQ